MAVRREPERSIREVMETGGWVRRTLSEHQVPLAPEVWRGKPGAQVAVGLLTEVEKIDMGADPTQAEHREEVVRRCSEFLGETAVPVVQVTPEAGV